MHSLDELVVGRAVILAGLSTAAIHKDLPSFSELGAITIDGDVVSVAHMQLPINIDESIRRGIRSKLSLNEHAIIVSIAVAGNEFWFPIPLTRDEFTTLGTRILKSSINDNIAADELVKSNDYSVEGLTACFTAMDVRLNGLVELHGAERVASYLNAGIGTFDVMEHAITHDIDIALLTSVL